MPGRSSLVKGNGGDGALSFTPSGDDLRRGRPKGRGRGGKWGRGQESRAVSDGFSDEESNMSASPVDTYTTLTGFNLTKGGRERARGRGRGRGRGKTPLKSSEPEAEASDDDNDINEPGSSPETLNAWLKGRPKVNLAGISREVEASPSARKLPPSKSSGVLPKMVLGIAHEGEVTWDAKWRPVTDAGGGSESAEGLDEREFMRLGFLAVILGDGSVQVWVLHILQIFLVFVQYNIFTVSLQHDSLIVVLPKTVQAILSSFSDTFLANVVSALTSKWISWLSFAVISYAVNMRFNFEGCLGVD
jgi:hypothetical protein